MWPDPQNKSLRISASRPSSLLQLTTSFQTSKKTFNLLQMPIQLIRKLSLRKNSDPSVRKHSMRPKSQCDAELPADVLHRIIDLCDPLEQVRMRALNKATRDYVDRKIKKVTKLEVRKTDIEEASTSDWTVMGKRQVALRLQDDKADIIVDSKWTSRDIQAVVGMMSVFRQTVEQATIDAPIAELLVVSLSALDLNRWYAFQCYMKALSLFEADIHLDCEFTNPGQVYWPNVQELTIRTTEQQASHLARTLDYGVQCNWVLDRQTIERLRIEFTDLNSSSKSIRKHLYHFRCWVGSAGFDHRFEQKFKPTEVLI